MNLLSYFDVIKVKQSRQNKTLAEKYAPENVSEFLGNYKQIKDIDAWFEKGTQHLVIVGPTGCGKTTLLNLMCEKHGKTIYLQNSLHKRTKTELFKYYESVKGFVHNGLFVFDELETIQKSENVSLNDVSKWQVHETKPVIRIVFLCNETMLNKLTPIMPMSHLVRLEYPPAKTLFAKCLEILDQEKIELSESELIRLKGMIAETKEPRMIFNSLNLVGIADSHKDSTLDMYSIYRLMLQPHVDLDTKFRYFSCESGTIPIIMQENYIDSPSSLRSQCAIADSMSEGDVYHKAIFVNNDPMQMNIYACLSSVFHPMFERDITKEPFFASPRFGSMWTRMSAMYQKRKYWSRFDEHCHDPYINTTVCIANMNDIYKHLFANDHTKFVHFLRDYRLDDVDLAFDLYNAYNVSSKVATKKSFITNIQKVKKNHDSSSD